ncbi:MAG: twin-arginine translocase TatA/TatE family subunit [Rhodothermaceae bacterium]|nr:twin-arginine translocase TatA/TatE family subunit [Rhodothermaceae bacterium]
MMGGIGSMELIVIFLVILLVFGAKRIPEIARGLGKGIREFKTATKEIKDELNVQAPPRPIQPPAQTTAPRADAYQQPAAQPAPQAAPQADSPAGTGTE